MSWFAVVMLALVGGCEEERPPPTFRVTFTAHSDGDPLAGVRIVADGQELGLTGVDGTLGVTLTGREGQQVTVNATCPAGHRPPEQLPLLTLRTFRPATEQAAARGIEMTISCPPAERLAAVVVRAQGGPDLPIVMRGREVARTDEQGVAHLLLKMRPNTTFQLQLDTSEQDKLRPQNPGFTFTLPDTDEIFLVNQRFQEERRRRTRRRPPPPPSGPVLPMRL
jgi:hypothetical protein